MPTPKTTNSPAVDILLSTYNGFDFLEPQIESLLKQSHEKWRLLIRDDGSTDRTVKRIKEYVAAYPDRIEFIQDDRGTLGPTLSFSCLLEYSTAEYSLFCDQDDVWFETKVELTLKKMRGIEAEMGPVPVLVHTDMTVTDSNLQVLSGSFWKYQNLNPDLTTLKDLLLLNNITGCTVMVNGPLRRLAAPIPPEAVMHDWWIALVASAFGYIGHVNSPTLYYRQHGGNVAGSTSYSAGYFLSRLGSLGKTADLLTRVVAQAVLFLSMYRSKLVPVDQRSVIAFASLQSSSRFTRIVIMVKNGFKATGFMRNLGIYLLLFFMPSGTKSSGESGGLNNAG